MHIIRSRLVKQRTLMSTRLNRPTNGFKILVQLLEPVTAEDSTGCLGEAAQLSTPALLVRTLYRGRGGSSGSPKKTNGLTVNSTTQTDSPAGKTAPQVMFVSMLHSRRS